jgi:hypothetical protein
MNIKLAAEQTLQLVSYADGLPLRQAEYGIENIIWMLVMIKDGRITGEKAHRWLGWAQACICIGGGATMEELKEINAVS